jgi:hypothetical protein
MAYIHSKRILLRQQDTLLEQLLCLSNRQRKCLRSQQHPSHFAVVTWDRLRSRNQLGYCGYRMLVVQRWSRRIFYCRNVHQNFENCRMRIDVY